MILKTIYVTDSLDELIASVQFKLSYGDVWNLAFKS